MVLSHCAHCAVRIMHSPPNWGVTVDLQRRSHFNEATNFDFSVEQRFSLCAFFHWVRRTNDKQSIFSCQWDFRCTCRCQGCWLWWEGSVDFLSPMKCSVMQCDAVCIIATTVVLNPLPKVPLSAKDVNPVSPLELKAARVFHSGSKMHLWKMCTANAKFTLSKKKGWKLMFACKSSLLKRC